jgi:tetratricopeptide (TPR) repeat protein
MDSNTVMREIEQLVQANQFENALRLCDEALLQAPDSSELLREKASVLNQFSRTDEAIAIMEALASKTNEPSDYFDLARYYVKTKEYSSCVHAIDTLLSISKQEQFDYYDSSARFIRAFAFVKSRQSEKAKEDIAHLEADMQFWIPGEGLVTVDYLRRALSS